MSRWAPGLSPRTDERSPLLLAGLVALALLAAGEAAPGAFPVGVSIEGHGTDLLVSVDGQSHALSSLAGPPWAGVAFDQPGPVEREYQLDGSDTTATDDRRPQLTLSWLSSPLYRLAAWLRDEPSYSRWERLRIVDLSTGETVSAGSPLPATFRVEAALRRPEAAARLWLTTSRPDQREGLELDRDRRNARWLIVRNGLREALPRWFFPEQPLPFAAELLHLVGRSTMAGYGLVLAGWALSAALGRWLSLDRLTTRLLTLRLPRDVILAGWLLGAALVTTRLYHQLPHILDAVSYTFQAGLLSSGQVALPEPLVVEAFKGPFEVVWQGHVFSQYPPGAPAAYAMGRLIGLPWIVGPLSSLALLAATTWTAGALFGRGCSLLVLGLGAISPFILFQAGSFLSHPIAGGVLACALAAFVQAERRTAQRWYVLSAALLGIGFLSREAASVLFAVPLGLRLIARRAWRSAAVMGLCGLPFVVLYLAYNTALTGSPTLLPRFLFDPSDHFGFGDGIGFHTRHTLAAGLVNTDELLTLLQFDLFGWPPLFALGLLGLPFLLGRARTWDRLAAVGGLAFVVAYVGYFYHGIALGPRYYYEAMPWLLLLAGRGGQVLARLWGNRLAVGAVLGLLTLNTALFYLPAAVARRTDLSGSSGGRAQRLSFVQTSLLGPRLIGVPHHSLVLTADWWLYNTALAALNCPRLPDCDTVFALASSAVDELRLTDQFADRTVLRTLTDASGETVDLVTVATRP